MNPDTAREYVAEGVYQALQIIQRAGVGGMDRMIKVTAAIAQEYRLNNGEIMLLAAIFNAGAMFGQDEEVVSLDLQHVLVATQMELVRGCKEAMVKAVARKRAEAGNR